MVLNEIVHIFSETNLQFYDLFCLAERMEKGQLTSHINNKDNPCI